MNVRDAIERRISVRRFLPDPVPKKDIEMILDAGRLAPSGKNVQNRFFFAVTDREVNGDLADITAKKMGLLADGMEGDDPVAGAAFRKGARFTTFFKDAPLVIWVFAGDYPIPAIGGYLGDVTPEEKDRLLTHAYSGVQGVGAAVENMYLQAVELGYGCCWMTGPTYASLEIEGYFKEKFGFDKEGYHLMCVLPVGVPQPGGKTPPKKPLEEISRIIE